MNATKQKPVSADKKASAPKLKRGRAAAKMRKAADEILVRDCKPIIEALSSNGKKGQMDSAKFLYGLAQTAEASTEGEGGASKFRSIALQWANSPEWKGESEAETAVEDGESN
jgi:hypothetical protein